jgi:quercetin dioxygenase-like cupin family protein
VEIESAELLLPCAEPGSQFADTLTFFIERLGFCLDAIFPADDPAQALLVGHGLRIRLQRGGLGSPGCLRLRCRGLAATSQLSHLSELIAPNGTRIELVDADTTVELPALVPEFVLARREAAVWGQGRASMRYRDLIPGRQGGRFIASHIEIPDGGPVPDYVHYHLVRLQLIYCHRGWVRVVYEDQGEPFVLHAGDCVLQPPGMRHRVLESSPGLEVIELSCPAEHETRVDHSLCLPNATIDRERRYAGQRFVHHRAATASWDPDRVPGFELRELGIAAATDQLADVHVLRPRAPGSVALSLSHEHELSFLFVLDGEATLAREGEPELALVAGDAVTLPAGGLPAAPGGRPDELRSTSPTLQLLRMTCYRT